MLTSLALILLCGLLLGSIFQKLRMPSLIGMLITGILLGPYVFNLLDHTILSISADLRELALIIILTRAGLSLDLADLKKIGRPAILMSFVPACFEMCATILIAPILFHIPLLDAAILAAVVASASPAVIVPRMLKLMDKKYGTDKSIPQLILTGDTVDDVFNIVVFSSLLGLAVGEEISVIHFATIPISIVLGIVAGIIIGYLMIFLFKKINMRDTIKVVVLMGIAILLVSFEDVIAHYFPFSGLIATMASGVIIFRKSPHTAKKLSKKFSKMWVVAEVLLFVLVGASVNIHYATTAWLQAILLLLFVLSIRAVGILLCLLKTNLTKKERFFCMLTGIPKATVQAAIGGIPLAMNLPNGEIILAIAVTTILLTAPLGAFLIDSTYKHLLAKQTDMN